jgi:hypothetical protein
MNTATAVRPSEVVPQGVSRVQAGTSPQVVVNQKSTCPFPGSSTVEHSAVSLRRQVGLDEFHFTNECKPMLLGANPTAQHGD